MPCSTNGCQWTIENAKQGDQVFSPAYFVEFFSGSHKVPHPFDGGMIQKLRRPGEHPVREERGEDPVDVVQQLWCLFVLEPAEALSRKPFSY